jgi:hypothetical protein
MYTPTEKSQFQAWAIKQGRLKLAPVHQEILDWIKKQFGVHALDFSFEMRETSKGAPQLLIHLILETVDDVKRMQANRANNEVITERFCEYFKSADLNTTKDPLKSTILTNPLPEIIVTYRPLKELTSEMLQEMREDEKRDILKTVESAWTISQSVVFFYTDAQVKENQVNGTSAKIIEELEQIDKKYGFSPGFDYRFDSKETFDRDYESNWYYYWK